MRNVTKQHFSLGRILCSIKELSINSDAVKGGPGLFLVSECYLFSYFAHFVFNFFFFVLCAVDVRKSLVFGLSGFLWDFF